MRSTICLTVVTAILAGTIGAAFVWGWRQPGLTDSVIRLHVVANSDSETDQRLKLLVRDAVVKHLQTELSGAADKNAAHDIITAQQPQLLRLARRVLDDNGCVHAVSASVAAYDFPARAYGDFVLPAGRYEALKINIGAAAGRNWWCVLFPPLCFIDEGVAKLNGDHGLLLDNEVVLRFKIAELMRSWQ